MDIKQIIEAFNQDFPVPTEAIKSAIERKEEITPVLLELIKNVVAQKDTVDCGRKDDLVTLFLLAQFREKQVFPYIIQLANLPEALAEDFWGDVATEHLTSFIVSTYNGDLQAIRSLVENRDAYVWCRLAALNSLLGLFALQQLSRDEIIAYFRTIFTSDWLKKDDETFINFFAYDVYKLYPQELYTELINLFDKELADEGVFGGKKDIDDILQLGIEQCLKENIYNNKEYLPVTNLLDDIAWLYSEPACEDDEEEYDEYDEYEDDDRCQRVGCCVKQEPVTVIKIGRNEPCPCDSGKKYKKCCLDGDLDPVTMFFAKRAAELVLKKP